MVDGEGTRNDSSSAYGVSRVVGAGEPQPQYAVQAAVEHNQLLYALTGASDADGAEGNTTEAPSMYSNVVALLR